MRNGERDRLQHAQLVADGWRVIVVWECELAKPVREARLARLYDQITAMPDGQPGIIDDTIPAGGKGEPGAIV